MQEKPVQSQAEELSQYLNSQVEIAQTLMQASRYSELPLKVHRNFQSAKLVSDVPRRARTAQPPNFRAMQGYMAREYANSPVVSKQQRDRFISKLGAIQVPRRRLADFQREETRSGAVQASALQQQMLSDQSAQQGQNELPKLLTASDIMHYADEIDKPVEQRSCSTYIMRNWQMTHRNRKQQTASILQGEQAKIDALERREIELHTRFWEQLRNVQQSQLVRELAIDRIYSSACNLDRAVSARPQGGQSKGVPEARQQRALSARFGRSRLSQRVYYEDLAAERSVPKSCCRLPEQRFHRDWKGFSVNELRAKHRQHCARSLNEIGVGKTVDEIAARSESTCIDAQTAATCLENQSQLRSRSCGRSQTKSASASHYDTRRKEHESDDIAYAAFEIPPVLQQYKNELDVQLEKLVRANSVDRRRACQQKPAEGDSASTVQHTAESAAAPEKQPIERIDDEFKYSLAQIRKQMLIPGVEPLPEAFEHFYKQFKPEVEAEKPENEAQTVVPEPLEYEVLLTTDLQRASLLAKAEAVNSAAAARIARLTTEEDEENERSRNLRNYKPPVERSPQEQYLIEQKRILKTARFPVETFPQLALFTKLSSLDVEGVRAELQQQIATLERAQLEQQRKTAAPDSEATSMPSESNQQQYERNFLQEMRSSHAQVWNQRMQALLESTEPKQFRRKHFPEPKPYDGAAVEQEILQQMQELQCATTDLDSKLTDEPAQASPQKDS